MNPRQLNMKSASRLEQPSTFFTMNCLLCSRTELGLVSGEDSYVQDVDVYLEQLLATFADPDVFERRGSNGVMLQERSVEEKALFYYTLAKSYAQAGDEERMLRYVRFALENGFKQRNRFLEEPEFAAFKESVQFKELLAAEQNVL